MTCSQAINDTLDVDTTKKHEKKVFRAIYRQELVVWNLTEIGTGTGSLLFKFPERESNS
jgi:hypothetical protein